MPPVAARRLPGLDLLRAFAVLWVMLYHYDRFGPPFSSFVFYGGMAVDLFFVLSGYLIGGQLLRPYAAGMQPRWGSFFLSRALRILPAYLAVLALYFLVPASRERDGIQPLWHFLSFSWNMLADFQRNRTFSHVWSLCVEEHFYLLLPPVVWLMARKPGAARTAALVIGLLAGGIALRAWIWHDTVAPALHIHSGDGNFYQRYIENIYYPIYTRLDGLLAGVTLALVQTFRPAWWQRAMARGPLLLMAGLAGVALAMLLFRNVFSHAGAVAGYPILAIGLALVVASAVSPHTWLGRVRVPGAAPIAAMAFSLYLSHKLVFHWVRQHVEPQLGGSEPLAFGAAFGAALAAGALLYLAAERPGLRLRARLLRPAPAAAPCPAAG